LLFSDPSERIRCVNTSGEPVTSDTNPGTGQLRGILSLAASLAGLVGYVYLAGAVITWVRLTTARVPADLLTAVGDEKVLFAVGLKAIVFMAAVFTAICVLSYLAARPRWEEHGPEWHAVVQRGVREAAALAETDRVQAQARLGDRAVRTVAGFNVMVTAAVVALSVSRIVELVATEWVVLVAFFAVAILVAVRLASIGPLAFGALGHRAALVLALAVAFFASAPIGVLVLTSIAIARLGRVIARLERPTSAAGFLRSPLLWAFLTIYLLVALAYVAQPPVSFTRAVIVTPSGPHTGGYLARTSDGVYLITCQGLANATSTHERAGLIPAADVKSTTLGGQPYRLDSGSRPSLATLVFRALGIDAHPPTWFRVDLRARRATCGGEIPPGTADKALGPGVLVGPEPPGGRASGGEPPIDQTTPALADLAHRYQPTIEVTEADRFWPVSVASVLQDRGTLTFGLLHGGHRGTCLVRQGTCVVSPPTLNDLVPGGASTDYLDYPASLDRGDPTGEFQAFVRGQGLPEQTIRNWLSHPAALDPWSSAQVYFYDAGVGTYGTRYPGAPPGLRSLQYWFFYPYNYYPTVVGRRLMPTSPIAADVVNTDLHEGDWEHVSVLLDPKSLEPRYLYMARHDMEGQALAWNSPLLHFDGDHPIVQAAFGGHPTYPNTCAEHRRAILKNLASDWVVCGSGRFGFRGAATPLVDLARTSWACWPGRFGEATAKQLTNAKLPEYDPRRAIARYVLVAGPLSPLRQAENARVCG
jgi:hypothetical protein